MPCMHATWCPAHWRCAVPRRTRCPNVLDDVSCHHPARETMGGSDLSPRATTPRVANVASAVEDPIIGPVDWQVWHRGAASTFGRVVINPGHAPPRSFLARQSRRRWALPSDVAAGMRRSPGFR